MKQEHPAAVALFVMLFLGSPGAGSAGILPALAPQAGCLRSCQLLLAHDGHTKYSIVLPNSASPTEQFAVEELANYLRKLTGAVFPISPQRAETGKPCIYISSTEVPGLSEPLTGEAYAVVVDGEDVYLNGGRGRAVLYAVYDCLERLGLTWFAPDFDFYSGAAESIPNRPSLLLEVKESGPIVRRPRLDLRKLDVGEAISHTERNLRQLLAWMPKAGFNTLMVPMDYQGRGRAGWDKWREQLTPELQKRDLILEVGGHGYQNFLNARMEGGRLFKEHNEWFGQGADGLCNPAAGQVFCTSNEEAVRFVSNGVIEYLRARKEIQVFDFWPPDVGKWCECRRCLEQGSPAERHARLTNHLHSRMAAACPNVRLECLAYSETLNPPSTPLNPGILLDFCPINQNFEYAIFDERGANNREYAVTLAEWRRRFGGDIGIYTYYRKYAWKSLPVVIPGYIKRDLQWYLTKRVKAISIFAEPGDWFTFELHHYILGRLSWDPELDLDALLKKYCQIRFGAAAGVAWSILAVLEQEVPRFGSLPFTTQKTAEEIAKPYGKLADLERKLAEMTPRLQEPYRSHCNRLLLMCGYALKDLKIQESRAAGLSLQQIRALVLELSDFLNAHAQAGTFMVYFGLEEPRLFRKYGLAEESQLGGSRVLISFIPAHGYLSKEKVAELGRAALFEISIGRGRLWVCGLDLERSVEVDPAARRFALHLVRAAHRESIPGGSSHSESER